MRAQFAHARPRIGQQCQGAVHADAEHVVILVERLEHRARPNIRAEAAEAGGDLLAGLWVSADDARQRQQAERVVQRDRIGGHAIGQAGALGLGRLALGVRARVAELDVEAIGAALERDLLAGGGVLAQFLLGRRSALAGARIHAEGPRVAAFGIVRAPHEGSRPPEPQPQPPIAAGGADARVRAIRPRGEHVRAQILVQRIDHVADLEVARGLHRGRELAPEGAHHRPPIGLPRRNFVELLLHRGGEAGVHILVEEAHQEGGHHPPEILGDEAPLLEAHVFQVLQPLQDGGIGRGPPDPELLQPLDQARFRIARRRLGEVLAGGDLAALQRIVLRHRRQDAAVVILRRLVGGLEAGAGIGGAVVLILAIQLQEAVEGHHRPRRAEAQRLVGAVDIDRGLVQFRGRHLRRDGALPHQLIQPGLRAIQLARHRLGRAGHVGRADRLVRLLGVLLLRGVFARRGGHVGRPEGLLHMVADGGDRLARHLHAVGPHIGDVPSLIERLRRAHRLLRAHPQLARRFHLQGGRHEGRRRVAPRALLLDRRHRIGRGFRPRLGGIRRAGIMQVELVELAAIQMRQPRIERRAGGGEELRFQRPVFARLEGLDLGLALAQQPQCHRLHAPRRPRPRQLAPQQRRQRIAHQVIQRPAREIRVDQRDIEVARMLHRILHGALGDLVEGDALDILALQRAALPQHVLHVPGNRLAFAIGVGGEPQPLGPLQRGRDLGDLRLAAPILAPDHREILVGQDGAVLFLQVANVPKGGKHGEVTPEILLDRLGLGR
ncbi:hypothetical protein ROS9278_04991 [Roseomonas sp. CECT 9278]|nr:hypothetical protein ROS9278_04991 [Roseomonas sp. CECT 9278]